MKAIEIFAVVYLAACLYVTVQAIRQKLSNVEVILFAAASLVIPAYFFLGRL